MREKGRVSWFDRELRYGFIEREGDEPDVFVHWSKVKKDGEKFLNTGDIVEFEVKEVIRGKSKEKKLQAFDVEVIEEATPKAEVTNEIRQDGQHGSF